MTGKGGLENRAVKALFLFLVMTAVMLVSAFSSAASGNEELASVSVADEKALLTSENSKTEAASDDGTATVEITATLKDGKKPVKPKPKPSGGGGDDHHHDEDDGDQPKPEAEQSDPLPPNIPVVYLPGPGEPKTRTVYVKGDTVTKTIVETVTGNDAILPEPRKPVRLSVSGNGTVSGNNTGGKEKSAPERTEEDLDPEDRRGIILWLTGLLLLILILLLCFWALLLRKKKNPKEQTTKKQ